MTDSLVIATSNFEFPQNPLSNYEIQVKYRPSILENVKYWQVFEDEEQIKHFMEVIGEFLSSEIDQGEEKVIDEQHANWEETIAGHKIL